MMRLFVQLDYLSVMYLYYNYNTKYQLVLLVYCHHVIYQSECYLKYTQHLLHIVQMHLQNL